MNRGIWIAKKNQLCSLIKKVSDHQGGDDIDWLREYCLKMVENHSDDKIEEALTCFNDLSDQFKYVPQNVPRRTQEGICEDVKK